jgi:mono/diheme cytochrome c family protein
MGPNCGNHQDLESYLMQFQKIALAGLLALIMSMPAIADDTASIKRGHELAQLLCMRCHAITGPGPGPEEKSPPFATLVDRLSLEGVADQLLEGLPMGHDPMPKWEFSEQQAEDLLRYIEYIGRKKQLD